jgi:hypothetical protein
MIAAFEERELVTNSLDGGLMLSGQEVFNHPA